MLKYVSTFVLQVLPAVGAVVVGGFLLWAYHLNATHQTSAAKPLFDESITQGLIESAPRRPQPLPPVGAQVQPPAANEPARTDQAAKSAPAETRPAARVAHQSPRRLASVPDKFVPDKSVPDKSVADKPRQVADKREAMPLPITPTTADSAPSAQASTPPPAATAAPPAGTAAPAPKPNEPVRVLGVPLPPYIVAVGEKLDPTPILRTGGKVIDTVVATAKSVVPDFSR